MQQEGGPAHAEDEAVEAVLRQHMQYTQRSNQVRGRGHFGGCVGGRQGVGRHGVCHARRVALAGEGRWAFGRLYARHAHAQRACVQHGGNGNGTRRRRVCVCVTAGVVTVQAPPPWAAAPTLASRPDALALALHNRRAACWLAATPCLVHCITVYTCGAAPPSCRSIPLPPLPLQDRKSVV